MNIQSQAWADSKAADLIVRDGYTEEEARVAARQMQHFTFIYHLADFRGAEFNPSQGRDENGRWTGGGLSDNVKRGIEHASQWETTQPWNADKDALSGGVAGVRYSPSLTSEARNTGGKYTVGDKFFKLDADMRRQVLYHEVGHDLSDAMLTDMSAWKLVDSGDMPGGAHIEPRFDSLNGQTTPGEVIAEAYALLHADPVFLHEHFPVLATTVERRARDMGFPMPSKRSAEFNPDQERDEWGRWVDKGGAAGLPPMDAPGTADSATSDEVTHATAALRALPPELIREADISRIELYSDQSDAAERIDEYMKSKGAYAPEEGARGLFDRANGHLIATTYVSEDSAETGRVIYHEFAHALSARITDPEWEEPWGREWSRLGQDEGFSEAFAEWWVSKHDGQTDDFTVSHPRTAGLFKGWGW